MDVAGLRQALLELLGNERYRKFVKQLCRGGANRMRFWQESVWSDFVNRYPEYQATFDELRIALYDPEIMAPKKTRFDPATLQELARRSDSVENSFRQRTYLNRPSAIPICQFLIWPAFDPPRCWDVLEDSITDDPPILYRTTWQSRRNDQRTIILEDEHEDLFVLDPSQSPTFMPSIEVESAPILLSQVSVILKQFRAIRIPLLVSCGSMMDATRFELALGHESRISWLNQLPWQWRKLAPLIDELQLLFDSAFD